MKCKEVIFLPKIKDRTTRAKASNILMRPTKQPKINNFVYVVPTVVWNVDPEGLVHQNPTYTLKGLASKNLSDESAGYDLSIEMRRGESDTIEIKTSEWFLKNVSKTDKKKLVSYYVETMLADISILYTNLRGQEDKFRNIWSTKILSKLQ